MRLAPHRRCEEDENEPAGVHGAKLALARRESHRDLSQNLPSRLALPFEGRDSQGSQA